MLNKNNERELAYLVRVDGISPMDADKLECAHIGGWNCVVGKGEFKEGRIAVFFEIDSKLPEVEPFIYMHFLATKKYKIKSQKIRGVISQGLLVPVSAFGWVENVDGTVYVSDERQYHRVDDETRFLTRKLGVTYAVAEDNVRKARTPDRSKELARRYPKFFSNPIIRRLMKFDWFRKYIVYVFPTPHKKNGWPAWVAKTDEERIENMPWILEDKHSWIATEKIDGTSSTFTMKRKKFGKFEFYVCSRNVCFDTPDKQCYYDSNVYWEMANKYDIKNVLQSILKDHKEMKWVTIQGETFGASIQKNNYDMADRDLRIFNLVTSNKGRWNTVEMSDFLAKYNVPCVPILDTNFTLPNTIEELRNYVNSQPSTINGKLKEGIVFRSQDGIQSFKCVSPEYLLQYHI